MATDVAARGLDVDRISHVLNYDAPFDLNHTLTELEEPEEQEEKAMPSFLLQIKR